MKPPFEWDALSDQPKIIEDNGYKRRMRQQFALDYLKIFGASLLAFPAAIAHMSLTRKEVSKRLAEVIGIGVSLEKGPAQLSLIQELRVRHVLVRLPLWNIEGLEEYRAFAESFSKQGQSVLINVLQDREHIEDRKLLNANLDRIFSVFSGIASEFQIGNAINRLKWGFFSVQEYLDFFKTAQDVRDQNYPLIKLLGPAVIDFEYPYTIGAIFNNRGVRFDRLSALLYVDRMGAPDNKQYSVFDTRRKMRLLASLVQLSPHVSDKDIYITEVNWPLAGTGAYAPTSPKECVSEDDYCTYMSRYFKIAASTKGIARVYWHQLIAPGYGLVDNRGSELRKTPAFRVLQQLIEQDSAMKER